MVSCKVVASKRPRWSMTPVHTPVRRNQPMWGDILYGVWHWWVVAGSGEVSNGIGRARFYDLCGQPLGPADYLAIAEAVRVLILEDIPRLGAENYNQARRFVTLVDALYEAKVRLLASAADVPELLYIEGAGTFEFERTASRLREMQSAEWAK